MRLLGSILSSRGSAYYAVSEERGANHRQAGGVHHHLVDFAHSPKKLDGAWTEIDVHVVEVALDFDGNHVAAVVCRLERGVNKGFVEIQHQRLAALVRAGLLAQKWTRRGFDDLVRCHSTLGRGYADNGIAWVSSKELNFLVHAIAQAANIVQKAFEKLRLIQKWSILRPSFSVWVCFRSPLPIPSL